MKKHKTVKRAVSKAKRATLSVGSYKKQGNKAKVRRK
jgi:hypothetical protein